MLGSADAGLGLWTVYGVILGDWVIVLANAVGATPSRILLGCKIRDLDELNGRRSEAA